MKKHIIAVFIIIVLSMIAACSPTVAPTQTPAPTITPSVRRIALVMKTLTNPFFLAMEQGARRAEQELGIQLIVQTAAQETSVEQQIIIIESLIEEKVDAIVIAPGDSQALIPVLKKAQDAGIFIVNIDNQLDPIVSQQKGLLNVPFVSVDNVQGAYLATQVLIKDVSEPTEAVILEGIQTAQNAQDRKNGAVKAFEENKNISVVASETANWKIDEAYTVTKSIFTDHPNVKIVFASNDMMALGVIQYLREAKKTDVLVGGYDAIDEALAAIEDGTLFVTVNQQADLQGYTGIQLAVDLLNGKTLPAVTLVDVATVSGSEVK
jgi:ribose transport system substrate-binding protein